MFILGFDPGRDKCGLAIVQENRQVVTHQVVETKEALTTILNWISRWQVTLLVLGNQTTSKTWQKQLEAQIPATVTIVPIDERNSTLEARDRYWEMYPAQGLTRLLPLGMRVPPRAIDDIVAIILVERYLEISSGA